MDGGMDGWMDGGQGGQGGQRSQAGSAQHCRSPIVIAALSLSDMSSSSTVLITAPSMAPSATHIRDDSYTSMNSAIPSVTR